MTVGELVAELLKQDQNAPAIVWSGGYDAERVDVTDIVKEEYVRDGMGGLTPAWLGLFPDRPKINCVIIN